MDRERGRESSCSSKNYDYQLSTSFISLKKNVFKWIFQPTSFGQHLSAKHIDRNICPLIALLEKKSSCEDARQNRGWMPSH